MYLAAAFSKGKGLLLRNQHHRWAARRNLRRVRQCLLSARRSGAGLQGFERRKMHLGDPVEHRLALGRTLDLGRNELRFTAQLLHCHRDVLILIESLECLHVFRRRVHHYEFDRGHELPLLGLLIARPCGAAQPIALKLRATRSSAQGRRTKSVPRRALAGSSTSTNESARSGPFTHPLPVTLGLDSSERPGHARGNRAVPAWHRAPHVAPQLPDREGRRWAGGLLAA